MSDPVLLDVEHGIAVMTLNRPSKLNALNYELIDRLMLLLDRIEGEAAIRAVILTGAGERAFSAGADIHEFSKTVRLGADIAVRDFAVASENASFAKPEINLGMPPTFGGTQRLPRLAGRKRALEMLLTGEPFPPARALEIGLINQIVPQDDLPPAARDLAARIIRHSPLAVGSIITAVTRGLNMSIAEGLLVESEQFASLVPTRDLSNGLAAWIEQRRS